MTDPIAVAAQFNKAPTMAIVFTRCRIERSRIALRVAHRCPMNV
jgi:hypothetical protein